MVPVPSTASMNTAPCATGMVTVAGLAKTVPLGSKSMTGPAAAVPLGFTGRLEKPI